MWRLVLVLALVACASRGQAQVVAPTLVQFSSSDQATMIPVGTNNAGQPTLTSYQALLLKASDDAVSGPVVQMGSVVPKASVSASGVPLSPFQLSLTQLGLTIPTCTTLPCQQYSVVLTAIGPNGTSLRGVGSESPSFTAAAPLAGTAPAAPGNLLVK